MGILYRKGDILKALKDGELDVLGHGVNCSGGFGSGIAGQIAKQFPEVREQYMAKHNASGWHLGQVQFIQQGNSWIANCATQKYYGRNPASQPGGKYCSYPAIRESLTELKQFCQEKNLIPGIPCIGAGLAGGDWAVIEEIIKEVFDDMTVLVYRL